MATLRRIIAHGLAAFVSIVVFQLAVIAIAGPRGLEPERIRGVSGTNLRSGGPATPRSVLWLALLATPIAFGGLELAAYWRRLQEQGSTGA